MRPTAEASKGGTQTLYPSTWQHEVLPPCAEAQSLDVAQSWRSSVVVHEKLIVVGHDAAHVVVTVSTVQLDGKVPPFRTTVAQHAPPAFPAQSAGTMHSMVLAGAHVGSQLVVCVAPSAQHVVPEPHGVLGHEPPLLEPEPEPLLEPELEPLLDPELEPLLEPELEPLLDPELEPLLEPELDPLLDPELDPLLDPELEPLLEPELDPLLDPELEPLLEPELDPLLDPELDPLLEPELEPLLEPELEPLLEPELDPLLEPELDPLLEPELDPLLDPELDPELDPLLDPELDPELDPLLEPELDPLLDPPSFASAPGPPSFEPEPAVVPPQAVHALPQRRRRAALKAKDVEARERMRDLFVGDMRP